MMLLIGVLTVPVLCGAGLVMTFLGSEQEKIA